MPARLVQALSTGRAPSAATGLIQSQERGLRNDFGFWGRVGRAVSPFSGGFRVLVCDRGTIPSVGTMGRFPETAGGTWTGRGDMFLAREEEGDSQRGRMCSGREVWEPRGQTRDC